MIHVIFHISSVHMHTAHTKLKHRTDREITVTEKFPNNLRKPEMVPLEILVSSVLSPAMT